MVAANLNGAFPNYESEIARYNEDHTLAVAGLNADWKSGAWDNTGGPVLFGRLAPQSMAGDLSDGSVSAESGIQRHRRPGSLRRIPRIRSRRPSLQTAGGGRSNNGSNVNGTGQSDGPEETRDRLSALALNFRENSINRSSTRVKFGGRLSDREKTHHSNRWGLCAGTGSTTFPIPGDQNSQVCPAGTAGQNGVPPLSLANAGLSEFNAPSFTAPPLVYGNWDSLFPLVYPNSAAPAGSDMPLVRTDVTEKSYEGYVRLGF